MHQQEESLEELLENVEFYKNILDLGPPRKRDLIRYDISNWKLYKAKTENSNSGRDKLKFQEIAEKHWNNYCSFFIDPRNGIDNYL